MECIQCRCQEYYFSYNNYFRRETLSYCLKLSHISETQGDFGILQKTEDLQIYLVQMLSFQCTFEKTPWIHEDLREMPSPIAVPIEYTHASFS